MRARTDFVSRGVKIGIHTLDGAHRFELSAQGEMLTRHVLSMTQHVWLHGCQPDFLNARLKKLYADVQPDARILKEALAKKD